MCVVTRSMSVFSCSSLDGAECMRPSSVPISSSPLGDRTSCWMMSRACSRHWRYFTMLWTQRAPPNSLNRAGRQKEKYTYIHIQKILYMRILLFLTQHNDTRPGYNECIVTKRGCPVTYAWCAVDSVWSTTQFKKLHPRWTVPF